MLYRSSGATRAITITVISIRLCAFVVLCLSHSDYFPWCLQKRQVKEQRHASHSSIQTKKSTAQNPPPSSFFVVLDGTYTTVITLVIERRKPKQAHKLLHHPERAAATKTSTTTNNTTWELSAQHSIAIQVESETQKTSTNHVN